jgi:hypothetical protein
MATFKLTVENKFHGTSEEIEISSFQISIDLAEKVRVVLCDIKYCPCSNFIGRRGTITDEFGGKYKFIANSFGAFLQLVG